MKVFCNRCNNHTNHEVKSEQKRNDIIEIEHVNEQEKQIIGQHIYQIIECKGCETISFRSVDHFNNFIEFDEKSGKPVYNGDKAVVSYYPERLNDLLIEKRIAGVPFILKKTYQEIIQCYNFNSLILCAAGLRALVEGICNYYKLKGNLQEKIETLGQNGRINVELSNALQSHRFLGNNALHRLELPDKKELEYAIKLIELTLQTLFGAQKINSELKKLITDRVKDR